MHGDCLVTGWGPVTFKLGCINVDLCSTLIVYFDGILFDFSLTMAEANVANGMDNETDLVTCSICLELFSDPRALPCLHSFCSQCLEDLAKNKRHGKITCPLCNEKHNMAGKGISKFREDFKTKALVNKHLRVKRQKVEKDEVQSEIGKYSSMLQDHIKTVREAQRNLLRCKDKVQSEIKSELESIERKVQAFESSILTKIDAQQRCFRGELERFSKMESILSSMDGKSNKVAINKNKLKECLADLGKSITEWKLKYAHPKLQIQEFNVKDVFVVNFSGLENTPGQKPNNQKPQPNEQESAAAGPSTSVKLDLSTPARPGSSTSVVPGPSTSVVADPSTSVVPFPSTSAVLGPSTSAVPDPSTSTVPGPSTSAAPGPGPTTSGQGALQPLSRDAQSAVLQVFGTFETSWELQSKTRLRVRVNKKTGHLSVVDDSSQSKTRHRFCVSKTTGNLLVADDFDIVSYDMGTGTKLSSFPHDQDDVPRGIGMVQRKRYQNHVENMLFFAHSPDEAPGLIEVGAFENLIVMDSGENELKFKSEEYSFKVNSPTFSIPRNSFSLACTDDMVAYTYFSGSVHAMCISVNPLLPREKIVLDSQLDKHRAICLLESRDKCLLAFTGWHSHETGYQTAIRAIDMDENHVWDLDWPELDQDTAYSGRFDLRSIVTDGDNFYVANFWGGTVYAISSDGQKVRKIITDLVQPNAMAYCSASNRLCVQHVTGSDRTVNVYKITK